MTEMEEKLNEHLKQSQAHQALGAVGNAMMSRSVDFTRATDLTPEVAAAIDDAFRYHTMDEAQINASALVREAMAAAVKILVQHVPPCADRSAAIRKLREARMDANSAITHAGKY